MDKGIYTALSGGIAKAHELELIANNIANVNTPGFKRDTGTFHEYLSELRRPDTVEATARDIRALVKLDGRPPGDKSFVEMDGIYTNFDQGALRSTSRSLDIGLQGDGLFEVLTSNGVLYTRQGNFSISKDGNLVTTNGFEVLADQPGVAPERRLIALQPGPVEVTRDGGLFQNGTQVAQLAVREFHETQLLEKVGSSYYRNMQDANLKDEPLATGTLQGFLEGSNVDAVVEMTRLIEASRAYESHMQAIKVFQEIDGKTVNEIAKETT